MAAQLRSDSPVRVAKRPRSSEISPALSKASSPDRRNGQDDSSLPAFLLQSAQEIFVKFQKLNDNQLQRVYHGSIPANIDSLWSTKAANGNRALNRYTDIKPWDQTRIKLKVPHGSPDYINASAISLDASVGDVKRMYVATQGPRSNNVDHFWQMVWQQIDSSGVVVMLTQLTEALMEKCFRYFPEDVDSEPMILNFIGEDDVVHEGSVKVAAISMNEECKTTTRELILSYNGSEKKIWHLFFQAWPDFGVPQDGDRNALYNLIKLSREHNQGWESPRIVHCSAGVGRSGTFIALEHLMDEMDRGHFDDMITSDEDPIFDTVDRLREQRMTMVQSETQYAFLYECLASAFKQRTREKEGISTPLPLRVSSEKLKHGEPSPKAIRLSRGIQKLFTQIRSRSSSRKRDGEASGGTPLDERPLPSPLYQSRTPSGEQLPELHLPQGSTSAADKAPPSPSYFQGKIP